MPSSLQRTPINIDRTAWTLIRRFGDDSAKVAFERVRVCADRGDEASAEEWRLVVHKVVELHFAPSKGPIH